MPARQQVTFSTPFQPDVQHISIGQNVSDGAYILSLTDVSAGQPETSYSSTIAWNASSDEVARALRSGLDAELTVSEVGHSCISRALFQHVSLAQERPPWHTPLLDCKIWGFLKPFIWAVGC